jgi:hypothetical protein
VLAATAAHTLELAEQYFQGWQNKDAGAIGKLLHRDVHLTSPVTELTGRANFLETCERIFPMFERTRLRAKFGTDNEAMLAYDFILKPPIGAVRTANLITFEDGLIRSIELFFDARPFGR